MIPRQPGELEPADLSSALEAILRVLLLATPILLGAVFVQPEYARRWVAIVAAVYALCGAVRVVCARGRPRAAGLLLAIGMWAIVTASAVTAGGVAALAPWFYVIPVLVTGLLFGARAGMAASVGCVLTALALTIVEIAGRMQIDILPYTPLARWVALALALSLMGGLQWYASRAVGKALERSQKLVASIDGIVWEADAQTFQFTFVSPQAERILGYPRSRWLDEPGFWRDHIHPDDSDHAVAYCLASTAEMRAHEFEYRMIAADGRHVWLHDIVAVEAEHGRAKTLRGIMVDITERKLAETAVRASEARLRALSARLESAREEEGRRIAREIHDELGGTLTALKWDLNGVASRLAGAPDAGDVDRIRRAVPVMLDLVESTMTTVRRIASDLRPSVLDELGVLAAIEWQVRRFEARSGIRCTCAVHVDAPDLDREQATAAFRILQEILTNVLRHAEATHVTVGIRRDGDNFVLDVRDNGRGIAQEELAAARSLGLLGMRERALLVGGDVRIHGLPGLGTTVVVTIPLREAVTAAATPATWG